jgi:hypothetical protein
MRHSCRRAGAPQQQQQQQQQQQHHHLACQQEYRLPRLLLQLLPAQLIHLRHLQVSLLQVPTAHRYQPPLRLLLLMMMMMWGQRVGRV